MAVIGERQVTGGNGGNPSAKQDGCPLVMEGFWRCAMCRIIAVINYLDRFTYGKCAKSRS